MEVLWQWVPCERNSLYNFISIFFLNFAHVFPMVWRFACGLDIILELFFTFFPLCEFCHFLTSDSMQVYRQWVPCERNSSYNFIPIVMKLCTCFRHSIEMCIRFGYNPWINFCHFFPLCELCHFLTSDSMKVYRQWLSASLYTISCLSFCNFANLFFHGLKMCMWFGFNPGVNFCHFPTLLTLSFFAGATSTSPKFDLYY